MTFDHVITLTGGNDTIVVPGSSRDLIFGLGGRDRSTAATGADCIVGGDGDDGLEGGNGDDVILGGPGNDKIEGDNGNDKLYGGAGNDTIDGRRRQRHHRRRPRNGQVPRRFRQQYDHELRAAVLGPREHGSIARHVPQLRANAAGAAGIVRSPRSGPGGDAGS